MDSGDKYKQDIHLIVILNYHLKRIKKKSLIAAFIFPMNVLLFVMHLLILDNR